MQATDKQQFAEVMQYLSLNFPERETSSDLIRSYFHDLSEFSVDSIWSAAKAYVRTGDKFPLISDLIRLLSA